MVGNSICRQVPWVDNEDFIAAWEQGRTGYPWWVGNSVQRVENGCAAEVNSTHLCNHQGNYPGAGLMPS
jgi:hypothetical protein